MEVEQGASALHQGINKNFNMGLWYGDGKNSILIPS
jgi:hypothetical protein